MVRLSKKMMRKGGSLKGGRKVKKVKKTKRKLNSWMKTLKKAKSSNVASFDYKGKKYVRVANKQLGSVYKKV